MPKSSKMQQKSRQILRRTHRDNPMAKLVVSGCYPTLEKKNINEISGIDLIIDNSEKDKLVDISLRELNLQAMPSLSTEPGLSSLFKRGRNRAFIKIQDGCRHRCTFCIVTIARGNERSRKIDSITNEINRYHQQGVHEVVLTGVHVGGYGSDINFSLHQLVEKILSERGNNELFTKYPKLLSFIGECGIQVLSDYTPDFTYSYSVFYTSCVLLRLGGH